MNLKRINPVIELDKGHSYRLYKLDKSSILDSSYSKLVFVKRVGRIYPGNKNPSYSGTTLQFVLRSLILRVSYLQKQNSCMENSIILFCLKLCCFLLEFRANRRDCSKHNKGIVQYFRASSFTESYTSSVCSKCGHVVCSHWLTS